jgi:four helix bundle protein
MGYNSFEKLDVWKKACVLAVEVYKILSDCKDYDLKRQMNRAALSIASNIAEGAERNTVPEYIRFLRIAKGSAAELRTQFYIADKIGLISHDISVQKIRELKEISSMLQGLINSFKA